MADIAHYTFVSWLRQGVAAHIDEADDFGAQPSAGPTGRAGISIQLLVDYVPAGGGPAMPLAPVPRRVELVGPGDILGIKPGTILRTEPYQNAVNATPGELAFVEFYEEDFPWRYAPARAAKADEDPARQHKLRPWLALLVLRPDEFSLLERPGDLPVVTVAPGVALPPAGETWAWAHAQIGREVAATADVHAAITSDPNGALSRLMSPRQLLSDTAYVGFVVPAFETGRLAGLKELDPGTPAQQPSWGAGAADRRFPVYFRWGFKTGTAGDFETLARKLVARTVGPEFGKRPLDIGDAGYGMLVRPGETVGLEGALRPPGFVRLPFVDAPAGLVASELRAIVDLSQDLQAPSAGELPHPLRPTSTRPSGYAPILRPSGGAEVPDDPIVTPPAYGRSHADVVSLADAASDGDLAWLREVNLDPRSRAAAGLGTEVVRQQQDELMERAWKQVGEIEQANQRMREAELAATAADALHLKHLAVAKEDRLLTLTVAAQRGLRAPGASETIRHLVDSSRVPSSAQSATFKRVSRPQRKLMRRLTGTSRVDGMQAALLTRMNLSAAEALSSAPPKHEPGSAVPLELVAASVIAGLGQGSAHREPKLWFLELLQVDLAGRRAAGADLDQVGIGSLKQAVGAALTAAGAGVDQALTGRVRALITAIVGLSADGPDGGLVTIEPGAFQAEFGDEIGGKNYRGVTVASTTPPPGTEVARTADPSDLRAYQAALTGFSSTFVAGRPLAPQAATLPVVARLAGHILSRMRPRRSVPARVAAAIKGLDAIILARPATAPRPLRPVMASPVFEDPMFEPLRLMSQDHILPNVTDLPKDTITLMEPNTAFIEAYLAGLNVEMARELLWREYPTDQRGTYLRAFWDTRDAVGHPPRPDIKPIHEWTGSLGAQSQLPPEKLVLVVRGELLQKFPNTVVYAQEAAWAGGDPHQPRVLAEGGSVKYPVFHATLEPDIAIFGFDLAEDVARGHRRTDLSDREPDRPGWFFVLKERPGQVRFGADVAAPATGLRTWDDLAWDRVPLADATYARVTGADLPEPTDAAGVTWGASSAHQAYAMFQSPVLYARHAAEMLPSG